MHKLDTKSLEDLEFTTVLQQLAARCKTEEGKAYVPGIHPFTGQAVIKKLLGQTSEYVASFSTDNRIPAHEFEAINTELKLLRIENTTLEIPGFQKIQRVSETGLELKRFLKKFKTYFPLLHELAEPVDPGKEIPGKIASVIDRFGQVQDEASPTLKQIRQQMNHVRGRINQSFLQALQLGISSGHLDEIKESVVENRRVLAVKAMYRKKVRGVVMGASKTGSIVYVEPEESLQFGRELNSLEYDEKEEIDRILKQLTSDLRPFGDRLEGCQQYLTEMDVTAAKAVYAREMNAVMPEINTESRLLLQQAYHPLLYLANLRKKQKTWPQNVHMNAENRIIVISGPNAGGKSITLKTIGLLQLMLQSGLLVPVHERSSFCLFNTILTDIGDNQSIENHLSTYSYRLKNMNRFLKKCDENTLFLIDEFGTGSDPELGGALAEAFLEEFYTRGAFGLITTHYASLKALADELPHALNANMVFNSRTLEPEFQLLVGQAGSSFTFEVAEKNGIPFNLINKAKKKVAGGKVRFDASIAKMQKERTDMVRTGSRLKEEEAKTREEYRKLEALREKLKEKLLSYQDLYEHHQKMILLGNKVHVLAEKYFGDKKKRPLVSELLHLIETENSKRKKGASLKSKALSEKELLLNQEMQAEAKVARKEEAKKQLKEEPKDRKKSKHILQVGDRVRVLNGKAVGSIDSLEKNKAVVNYGQFTTSISVEALELVAKKN